MTPTSISPMLSSEEEPQQLNSTNQLLVLTLCIGIDAPDGTVVASVLKPLVEEPFVW
jgi:hypothetical protein